MFITLILIGIIILGFILYEIGEKKWKDSLAFSGVVSVTLGVISIFFVILFIIGAHIGVDNTIKRKNLQYESLCYRLELANSDYEDFSRLEIVKDITEWNDNTIDYKYWAENPWTSWFYSRKVADNLKIINY